MCNYTSLHHDKDILDNFEFLSLTHLVPTGAKLDLLGPVDFRQVGPPKDTRMFKQF